MDQEALVGVLVRKLFPRAHTFPTEGFQQRSLGASHCSAGITGSFPLLCWAPTAPAQHSQPTRAPLAAQVSVRRKSSPSTSSNKLHNLFLAVYTPDREFGYTNLILVLLCRADFPVYSHLNWQLCQLCLSSGWAQPLAQWGSTLGLVLLDANNGNK